MGRKKKRKTVASKDRQKVLKARQDGGLADSEEELECEEESEEIEERPVPTRLIVFACMFFVLFVLVAGHF